uniref:Uncharacterized protein n=1 Tax=viral metagenome TaxID=1070528 RepID=A0A6C0E1Q0_9ZZZZ
MVNPYPNSPIKNIRKRILFSSLKISPIKKKSFRKRKSYSIKTSPIKKSFRKKKSSLKISPIRKSIRKRKSY